MTSESYKRGVEDAKNGRPFNPPRNSEFAQYYFEGWESVVAKIRAAIRASLPGLC
jgi:hypothetical protein